MFPVAVKGRRGLSCKHKVCRADWKLKNFRPGMSVRERESRLVSASKRAALSFSTTEKLWRDLHVIQTTPFGEKLVFVCVRICVCEAI